MITPAANQAEAVQLTNKNGACAELSTVGTALADSALAEPDAAATTDDRLEAIAKHIESLTATATLQVGKELAKARDIFRYRRDEGGFAGWVEARLGYSRHTAYNLLHVHEQFGGQEVSKCLDTLGRSVLFLISAPSTPPEVRDEIIERAKNRESVSVAEVKVTINDAKGPAKKARPPTKAELYAASKLGNDTIAKIKGTSLDNAAEKRELVILNRGAPPGGLTKPVKQLTDSAAAGEDVSAIRYTKSGAAFRREDVSHDNAGAAPAPTLVPVAPKVDELPPSRDDIDSASGGELERLRIRVDELESRNRRLEIENVGLRSEIDELKARLALHEPHDGRDPTTPAWDPIVGKAAGSTSPRKRKPSRLHNKEVLA